MVSLPYTVALLVVISIFEVLGKLDGKHSRMKRYLDLPKGSALAVSLAISTFLPKDVVPEKILNGYGHIIEYDFLYPFPDRLEFFKGQKKKKPQRNKMKKKKKPEEFYYPPHDNLFIEPDEVINWGKSSREGKVLDHLKQFISRQGHNGEACVIRLACEANENLYFGRSLLEDVVLFLIPQTTKEECKTSFDDCSFSPLHIIMHSTPLFE